MKRAKGLAILTVVKAGVLIAYKLETGLVIDRRSDGTWFAPSAIFFVGLGWGARFVGLIIYLIANFAEAFVGVSLEGNIVATRMDTNLRYGDPYLTTANILLGTVNRPKNVEPLYVVLDDLYYSICC
ncbi:hypothetical protein REPUB_Repub18cG0125200 [Reevesia pubescens]